MAVSGPSQASARVATAPEEPALAAFEREATEFIARGAIEEDRRRQEAGELARMDVVGQRLQRVLITYRTGSSLEHVWAGIVELVLDVVEDEGSGRPRRDRGARLA